MTVEEYKARERKSDRNEGIAILLYRLLKVFIRA